MMMVRRISTNATRTLYQLMLLQIIVHLGVAPDRTFGTWWVGPSRTDSLSLSKSNLVDLFLGGKRAKLRMLLVACGLDLVVLHLLHANIATGDTSIASLKLAAGRIPNI